jgi:hypothetical protein
LKEINSISQPHGEDCAECLSSGIRYVLSVKVLGKLLTTLSQSKAVAIRWLGTTYKRCVIGVTMLNRGVNPMEYDVFLTTFYPYRGVLKLKNVNLWHHRPHKANTTAILGDKKSRCGQKDIVKG